ncbi:MAG: hypothetical protein QXD34_04275 [Candidatus Bathyarchaeia archaeon]|nr:hypothetical protein [Candidatus Bathyarchaeota archaeon]
MLNFINWLSNVFKCIEKGEIFCVAAEVAGPFDSHSEIIRGIAVKKGFRNIDIGTEMMKMLEQHARKIA